MITDRDQRISQLVTEQASGLTLKRLRAAREVVRLLEDLLREENPERYVPAKPFDTRGRNHI